MLLLEKVQQLALLTWHFFIPPPDLRSDLQPTPMPSTPPPAYYTPYSFPDGPQFPSDFYHGFATAAPQIEGSILADGKGQSVWDEWSTHAGYIQDNTTTEPTTGSYTKWRDDVDLLKELGANAYRLSLAWPRIVPGGVRGGQINEEGLKYYDEVIDGLLREGITPFVTLNHWDLPWALQEKYGGWLDADEIVADFVYYAEICFKRYGDRIKHWITINEPLTTTDVGFASKRFPPGAGSIDKALIAGHSILLAHGAVVNLYRSKFQSAQRGQIGIALCGSFGFPWDETEASKAAVRRHWDFQWNFWAEPIFLTGDYPQSMREYFGDRLPKLSKEQQKLLKGSGDFFAFNCYHFYAIKEGGDYELGGNVTELHSFADGTEFGWPIGENGWRGVPRAMYELVMYIHKTYGKPMYLTEWGFCRKGEKSMSVQDAIEDPERQLYYREHLDAMRRAVGEGAGLKGAFTWTLTDNWEWAEGFTLRFGAAHTDTKTLKRTPKKSAYVMKEYYEKHIAK